MFPEVPSLSKLRQGRQPWHYRFLVAPELLAKARWVDDTDVLQHRFVGGGVYEAYVAVVQDWNFSQRAVERHRGEAECFQKVLR